MCLGREDIQFGHVLNLQCPSPTREDKYTAGYKSVKNRTQFKTKIQSYQRIHGKRTCSMGSFRDRASDGLEKLQSRGQGKEESLEKKID